MMPLKPSLALLKAQTDERLVLLAQSGHQLAFDAIVDRYRKPLLRHCRRILPEGQAEDAVQQAFVQAWRALTRGDDVRDLRPWLYRIARNCALNAHQRSGFDHDELQDSLTSRGDEPEEVAERRAVVRQALAGLAALPERQREALLRMAVEGASQEELARDFGLSEGAVRQLVFRARAQVRAACTAVTPLPVAAWLAAGGLAGAPAGVAVGAKVATVLVVAGGAVTAPVMVGEDGAEQASASRSGAATDARRTVPAAPPAFVLSPTPDAEERVGRSWEAGRTESRKAREHKRKRLARKTSPGRGRAKAKSRGGSRKAAQPSTRAKQRVAVAKLKVRVKRRGEDRFKKSRPAAKPVPPTDAENERAKSRPAEDSSKRSRR